MRFLYFLGVWCFLSGTALADCCEDNLWVISANIGAMQYQHMVKEESRGVVGRLSFGYTQLLADRLDGGLELGVQNGNRMRFVLPKESLDALGGLPITAITKPLIDALVTLKVLVEETGLFLLVKGGAAYRELQVDRVTVNNLARFSFAGQVGGGYALSEHLSLNLTWQYIAGANPNFTVHEETETATITGIPAQQAILLGFSLYL